MKFADYIPLAIRTCKELPLPDHVNHMGLGIIGEMGEIVDQLKKGKVYGKGVDQVNIIEEVGDVAWYVAGLVNLFPSLHGYLDSDELRNDVHAERLAIAKARLTRTILMNTMAAANLVVDLDVVYGEPDIDMQAAESIVQTLCKFLFATAVLLDVDLGQALDVNIAKLAKRYGDKYTDYAALNRDLDGERAVLEAGAQA